MPNFISSNELFDRILDIIPQKLHERAPFFVGNSSMVEDAERFIAQFPDE